MFRQVLRTPIHFHCAAESLTPECRELISRVRKGNMEGGVVLDLMDKKKEEGE
jgi:hypothetical protein